MSLDYGRWMPVDGDEKPEHEERVLLVVKYDNQCWEELGSYDAHLNKFFRDDDPVTDDIVFWARIPKLPVKIDGKTWEDSYER